MHPEVMNANTTRKQIAVLYMKEITTYFFYCINLMNVNFIKTGVLRIRLFQAMMTTNVM